VLHFVAFAALAVGVWLSVQGLRMRRLYRARLGETERSLDELRALIKLEQHWASTPPPVTEEPPEEARPGSRKLVN
jgi:hypothetical protein